LSAHGKLLRHLVEIDSLTRADMEAVLALAREFERHPERVRTRLAGKLVLTMFFEASTRTRLSFESAALRLGAGVLGFSDAGSTSTKKGESLEDTVRMAMSYADVLVLRHPEAGSAKRAAAVSKVPVVNAGDGANEHPSQTLVDLFAMYKHRGSLDGVRIALVGDLAHGRTVHSLVTALGKFRGVELTLVAPPSLALPDKYLQVASAAGVHVRTCADVGEALPGSDFVYMTRIQKERFESEAFALGDAYRLDANKLASAPASLRVLHPLPRVDEIASDVDATPFAAYFEQAAGGVPVRQAILCTLLAAHQS
jgi:aspartate carbamoyltransferase catalytic subunit